MNTVHDMFGQEIKVGSTLVVARKDNLRLAEVESMSLTYGRNNPTTPTLSLRLVGRHDARYIASPISIRDASNYLLVSDNVVNKGKMHVDTPQPAANLRSADLLIGSSLSG